MGVGAHKSAEYTARIGLIPSYSRAELRLARPEQVTSRPFGMSFFFLLPPVPTADGAPPCLIKVFGSGVMSSGFL